MAIAFVQQTQGLTNSNVTSKDVTWAGNTTTGNFIVVTVSTPTGGSNEVSGVTDSQTNTYQRAIREVTTNHMVEIWYAMDITGGTTPTVTASFSGSLRPCMTIHEFSGVALTAALDQQLGGGGTGVTTMTIGPTSTTTVADELVFAVFNQNASPATHTAVSPYGNGQTQTASTTGTSGTEFQVVSSIDDQTATMTTGSTNVYKAAIATFKAIPSETANSGYLFLYGV